MIIIIIILSWLLLNTWINLFIGTYDGALLDKHDLFPIFMNTVFSYLFFWILRKIIKIYKKHKNKQFADNGKTIFLTKEEAEQALNNIQNGNSCEGGAE